MPIQENDSLSSREYVIMENERDESRLQREYAIKVKELELQVQRERNTGELLIKQFEAKWTSWLSIPKYIIKLPVMIVFGFAYIGHAIKDTKPSNEFWDFLKR